MLSINTSTYLAMAKELQSLLSPAELAEKLSRRGVEWNFISKHAIGLEGFGKDLLDSQNLFSGRYWAAHMQH